MTTKEIESFNSSACCEYFPAQEVAVQSEKMYYRLEESFTKDKNRYCLETIESGESFCGGT